MPDVAGEARRVAGPMYQLVQQGRVILLRRLEALETRHADEVALRIVVDPPAAVANVGAGGRDELLQLGDALLGAMIGSGLT